MDTLSATFGGNGPRACLRKNLALVCILLRGYINTSTDRHQIEVQLFLARLMRNFDIEVVHEDRSWRVVAAWFASQNDFFVRLKQRNLSNV
jgi:hypothetical protein